MLQAVLSPGSTFVDVGANWGYFTLLAAPRVGSQGSAIAVEPEPRMCSTLRANLTLNDFPNVTVLEIAATEREGTVSLLPFDQSTGNFGLSRVARAQEKHPEGIPVAGRALDDVFAELRIRRVSLLKMDIEGGEGRAIGGLRRSLTTGVVERILLEVHPPQLAQLGSSVDEMFALLEHAGFRGWVLDHSPAASRHAAYARRLTAGTYLRPFDPADKLDAWPHLLWARRGEDPL